MEQMSASIAAKDRASRPGSTSNSSTDGGTIPAARVQVKEHLDSSPLGAAAATKLSVAQQLNQRSAEFRTVEQGITSEPAAEPPAKDLSDVSHRLKKLEKAVKAHLLGGPRVAGDASILASACGGSSILSHAGTQHHRDSSAFTGLAACDPHSPGGARLPERSRLRETLSDIKSDVADLAVRQVEAQLLQQRVLRLEAAVGGFGGLGGFVGPVAAARLSSSFTSLAGATASPGMPSGGTGGCTAAACGPTSREDAAPGLTRSPSDVSVLVNRLAGMEGVIKELAQAQVANTAVLQQIGGRLPSPVPASPDSQCCNTAEVGGFAPSRGSPVRSYPRPPSCPLTGGLLNSNFGCSPPETAQFRGSGRAPSPDSFGYPRLSFASATAYASPSHASSGLFARSDASSAASPTQAPVFPAIPTMPAAGQQPTQQQQVQTQYPTPWEQPLPQQRPQQQWQVEVVLAGHDADIAQVKEAVQQVEQHQQAADASAEATSAQVGSLVDRVAALEQSMAAVEQPGEATLRHMLQPAEGDSASMADAAASYSAAAVGTLDQADLVSAIEGLAADAVQAAARLDVLEGSLEHQLVAMDDLQGNNESVHTQLQQISSTMAELSSQVQSLQAASAATPPADHPSPSALPASTAQAGTADRFAQAMGSSVTCEEVQQQVLHQLLNSTELQQLVDAKVERLLHSRVEEAVAAQLAEAAGHAADMAASAAEAVSAVSSPAQSNSRLQALLSEDSASDDVRSLPSAVSFCPTPRVPRKLQDAFDALSERLQKMQSHAAAGQAEVIHEALQHLHNRLLQVEEVAQGCMNEQHNALERTEQTAQQQPVIQLPAGSSCSEQHSSSASSESLSTMEVSDDQPLLAGGRDVAAEAPVDEHFASADSAAEEHQQQLISSGADIGAIGNNSTERADVGSSVQWPKLVDNDGAPADSAALSSDMDATAAADVAIAAEASSVSTDQLERQVAALQQEMTSHQVKELQAAVEDMCRQMVAMQQALGQQIALIHQQRASTAASLAMLSPLERRVCEMAGQLAVLNDIAAQQPSKLEALQQEIEQLSRQLAEVNEGAADEAELADLKTLIDTVTAQQGSLQSQLDATQAVAAAAVQAATAASAEVATIVTAAQKGSEQEGKDVATIVPAAAKQLEALEASVQQQLASTQEALAKLQTEVEGRISEAAAQAGAATAAAANHSAGTQLLTERAGALASKLAALETAVAEDKAAAQCLLGQKTHDLQTAAAAHEGMLHNQMETMAHVLADLGQAKAEQADATHQLQQQLEALHDAQAQAAASQSELRSSLSRQLTATAQQLRDELELALGPLQKQLSAAEHRLAEHEDSIGSCAKASVLAGVAATLQDLPSAVAGLTGRLDELSQTQRAAEGQLHAAQEQHIVLNEQLATLKQNVETLASTFEQQQGHLSGEVERVSAELLAPVWADLLQLQELKQTLVSSQEQQTGAVQQLGAAVDAVRMNVMSELARSKDELAQSIEELHAIITERCLKTDQLGQIFAARDNMYGAWMKMQAVFESNKSHSGANTSRRISASNMLFKRRPSSTLSASTSIIAGQPATPFAPTNNADAAGAAQQPAVGAFDPFTEMVTRESSHSSSCPSNTMAQVEPVPAAAAAPNTQEAVMAASTSQQTANVAAESSCAAVVTPADLAAVLESQFQLRQTMAQLSEQMAALQQAQRQQVSAEPPGAFDNDVLSAEDSSSTLGQLHAAVAQLYQQLAAVQRQQMQMTTPPATPAIQPHLGLTQRSDSSAFLLTLQQELAGIAAQVSELHTKVQKQEVQIEAVVGTSATVLHTVTEAAEAAAHEYTQPTLCNKPFSMCLTAAAAGAAAADKVEELQQQLVALAAKVDDLQQQSFSGNAESSKEAETVGQKEKSVADDPPPASPACVLHAPLSVVVRLQEELAGLKESQVSKDQFAAVVRMVRAQKDHSTATDAINGGTLCHMGSMLQQHAEQLAGVDFSIDSILSRLEAAATASVEAVDSLSQQQQLQQQISAAAIGDLSNQHAMLASGLAALQKAIEQQAAALDDCRFTAQEHAYQLTSQQHTAESLTAELANIMASVEDLSAKLAAEREAHTQLASMVNAATAAANMPRRAFSEGQEAPGSGFSELVAGIARLKDCTDATSQTVSGLQQRLEVQEAVIAGLAAAAAAQTPHTAAEAMLEGLGNVALVAATAGETQERFPQVSSSCLAHGSSDQQPTVTCANVATKADVTQQAADLQAQVEYLNKKIAAVERQQQQHQEQHENQKQPAASIPSYSRSVSGSGRASDALGSVIAASASAISNSASFSRRVSKISSIAAADAVELTAAAADEAAVAVAGPMALVHQILMELKKRVEALEAKAAAAVNMAPQTEQAGTSTAPIMHSNQLFVPSAVAATPGSTRPAARKPAPWQAAGDAATIAELQELVINLQQDEARIDMESSSNAANLMSLRGDVGAAAAAAAQAAAAATAASNQPRRFTCIKGGEPGTAAAAVAAFDAASISAEASAASAVAAAAQEAAEQAQAAASAVQDGLRALTQELQLLQKQTANSRSSAESCPSTIEAVTTLKDAVSSLKATVDQISSDSVACSGRAAEEQANVSSRLQDVEEQVQRALAAAASSTATATAAVSAVGPAIENHEQRQQLQQELAELKRQLTQCLTSAAAAAGAATAITELKAELQALQDQVAWASSEAAAAACTAASNAVEDVKEQLVEDLQGQLGRAVVRSLQASLAGVAPELAAAAAVAAVDGASEVAADASMAACAMPATAVTVAAQPTCSSGLSFNDLASAPSPTSRALVQQLLASVANTTGTCGAAAHQPAEKRAATPVAGNTIEAGISEASPPPQQQQQSPLVAAADGGCGSLLAGNTGGAPAAAIAVGDLSSHQLLGAQLALLSAAQQVEFICKLAGVVSSHATRLLATYQDEPALAKQLHTVQERLSAAAASAGAASKAARASESSSAVAAVARRFSASSSISSRSDATQRPDAAGIGGFAAGQVLLGILDQVASLRAIGSATHPAISQAVQKHETQIAALLEAQQQLQKTHATNTAVIPCGSTALAVETATVQGSSTSGEPDSAAPAPANGNGESFEGEYNQRLSALESRLASGLKVLSEVRSKLSPLHEVADATQSMMRELQVAHGLVLQRLEALEGLASAGAGADSAGADERKELSSSALAVAGSMRQMKADVLSLSRRLSAAEASLASTSECLTLSRRLAARMADADNRGAQLAGKVSSVVSSLPVVVERMVDLEGRISRSLGVAKRGLDILADQLVALGALNGRGSPSRNPLAALGPNHAAITALEGKVEAVRTAMTASVRLMIADLATDAATAGSIKAAPGLGQAELGAGVVSAQLAASEAVNAAMASHQEALNGLESKIAEMQAELHTALAAAGKQNLG